MFNAQYIEESLRRYLPSNIYQDLENIHSQDSNLRHRLIQDLLVREDPGTAAHVQRVARGTVQIASVLECPADLYSQIFELAEGHDNGKFGILDITRGAKVLTRGERAERLPIHAIAGAQIAGYMEMSVAQIVVNLCHHIATKGYPSLDQIANTSCLCDEHLNYISDIFYPKNGGRMPEIYCDPRGTLIFEDHYITRQNPELYDLFFGIYAAYLVTAVDGPDAVLFPRIYNVGENGNLDVRRRHEIAWNDLSTSNLPVSILDAAKLWIPTAHVTLLDGRVEQSLGLTERVFYVN